MHYILPHTVSVLLSLVKTKGHITVVKVDTVTVQNFSSQSSDIRIVNSHITYTEYHHVHNSPMQSHDSNGRSDERK
jgi:hypothetical protein